MQDSVHVMIMTMTTRNLVALSFLASIVVAANAFAPSAGGGGRRYLSSIRTWSSSALGMGSGGGGSGGGGGLLDNLVAFLKNGKVGLVKSLAGDYDAVAVRNKIDGLVKENSVLMFSFTTCPYCIKAKSLLNEKGAKYTVVELDQVDDGKAIRAELGEILGRTSVPAIWINGEFIGGCNDGPPEFGGINTLNSINKLDGMLIAAGAM